MTKPQRETKTRRVTRAGLGANCGRANQLEERAPSCRLRTRVPDIYPLRPALCSRR